MRMKIASIQQPLSPEALPPLCPPSDHVSAATYEDENGFNSATSLSGSAALPFVISTGAQRSGEISVLMPLLGNVFRRSEAVPQTSPGNVF
jgi:hypothetical protein